MQIVIEHTLDDLQRASGDDAARGVCFDDEEGSLVAVSGSGEHVVGSHVTKNGCKFPGRFPHV